MQPERQALVSAAVAWRVMPDFEDELRAGAHEHESEWTAERDHQIAETHDRAERTAKNTEGVASFLEAMAKAGCRPERWRVRTKGIDDKRHRHRAMRGWAFDVDGVHYFVTKAGSVYVARLSLDDRGRGTLHHPETSDLGMRSLAAGLAERYRLATGSDA